jgi:nitroimidazol reductase NimA-like FMN-containing flavoprotein (pyridoxamine 5'-phosphate oxidase superfamily)
MESGVRATPPPCKYSVMTDDTPPDERARRLIDAGRHMTIATTDGAGRPWASPVFYCVDDDRALYWVSDKDALHSSNVRNQPDVAIVIYETGERSVDAVHIQATVTELNDKTEALLGIDVMASRDQGDKWKIDDVSEVTGDGPWRIYRANRKQTQVRAERMKQGKPVVGRENADF